MGSCKVKTKTQLQMIAITRQIHKANFVSKLVENLKSHIHERLPEQYQKCTIGLNQVLKMGWDIVHNDYSTAANRLQALALINDSYKYMMDQDIKDKEESGVMRHVMINQRSHYST